jgi:hypothetical protein
MPEKTPAVPARTRRKLPALAIVPALVAALSVACAIDVPPSGGILDIALEASAGAYADRIVLSWPAVPGAVGYNVYACDVDVGLYEQLNDSTIDERTYECREILPYFRYFFKITAITADGESPMSRSATGWVRPANLLVEDLGAELVLSWDAVIGAEAYILEVAKTADGPFYRMYATTDTGMVLPGTDYSYDDSLSALVFSVADPRLSARLRVPASDSWFRVRAIQHADGDEIRSLGGVIAWSKP